MNNITVRTSVPSDYLVIPGYFIDHLMPEANGEFVKVYLYLHRQLSKSEPFSFSGMADQLNCTEGDLIRALKYWKKREVLDFTQSSDDTISDILFLPLSDSAADNTVSRQKENESVPPSSATTGTGQNISAAITRSRRDELSSMEEIQELLFVAEQYLGQNTLNATTTDKILYFYDGLHFSVELIEYLIEYCVSNGHNSIRYIETVAFAWAERGIKTIDDAKKSSSSYHQDYYSVLKALGISGRAPAQSEAELIDQWKKNYGFSMEIILEACRRTILQTSQPSFPYLDRILTDWNKNGVHSISDIEKLDAAHQRKKKSQTATPAVSGTKFSNFPQRNYDFSDMEKRLLKQ